MPLKLVAPGKRKGNKHYLVRGRVPGRKNPIEVSTKTSDRVAAHRFKVALEQRLIDAPAKGAGVTFKQAADAYVLWRKPGKQDLGWIERLQADKLGAMLVSEVHHHHLVKAADRLCPTQANATRNRQIMIPTAAILHYAAEQHWCAWLRVKHFHEPQRPHKAITEAQAATLLANVPDGPKRALILWLFRQGDRISDPLRLTWEDNIRLEERLVYYHVRKSDDWLPYPLHDEVVVALANLPTDEDGKRKGKVFPWSHRWSVYKWLRPLVKSLGIPFTPHVARHSFATWHHDRGASEIELQKLGRWNHPQSVKRYTKVDVERVRAGINKIGQNVGKAVGNKS
jgi:integrase